MVWKTNFKGDETVGSVPAPSKREHVHKLDSNKLEQPKGLWSYYY